MKKKRIIQQIEQLRNSTFHMRIDGGVVFLLLLFCPYIFTMYMSKDVQNYQNNTDSEISEKYVWVEQEMGTVKIPLEEYIKGILPSILPMEYETTSFQVQAILLRTLYEKGDFNGYSYLSPKEREEYFGEMATEYERKLQEAIASTEGMYLASSGNPIEAAFCFLSAGNTRSGVEVLGEDYSYLQSVSCLNDLQSPEYQKTIEMEKEFFYDALGIAIGEEAKELPAIITDSAGYVLWVVADEINYNGEKCAALLKLPSSNFTWKMENEKVHITCKGIGHGFGCSQYSVNELAKEGRNYEEILRHFFTNITIEKIE